MEKQEKYEHYLAEKVPYLELWVRLVPKLFFEYLFIWSIYFI